MGEWDSFIRVAVAVALKAQEQGVARVKATREQLTKQAEAIIKNARETTDVLMKTGLIPKAPEDK